MHTATGSGAPGSIGAGGRFDLTCTWTLTAAGTALTLAIDPTRDFAILNLVTTSDQAWTMGAAADSFVHTGNQTVAFGSRAHFAYENVTTETRGNTLQLNAAFTLTALLAAAMTFMSIRRPAAATRVSDLQERQAASG